MPYIKTDTLLSVRNVGLSFIDPKNKDKEGKPTKKVILSDVNFDIKDIVVVTDKATQPCTKGQVISLVGKSGSGKTQLIRRMSGLYIHGAESTGEILIHHDKIPKEHVLVPVKEGDMGIVFQDYYMPEHLLIRNMLVKAAKKNPDYKGDKNVISDAVDTFLGQFELSEHKDKYPCQLSGGQKQRASIIMQLLNGSNFLLMDEPFSGLDPLMIDKTTKFLQLVADSDELKTLIIVSHDLANCVAISDTILVLSNKGRIITHPDGTQESTGATIVDRIDMLERGLAYHPEIKRMPDFHNTLDEIKELL
jgi:ABC-type nitrate/sulfonate/bicarbonate transport system ATPase subunit